MQGCQDSKTSDLVLEDFLCHLKVWDSIQDSKLWALRNVKLVTSKCKIIKGEVNLSSNWQRREESQA